MSHEMEMEDFIRVKDAELGALREELQRARLTIESSRQRWRSFTAQRRRQPARTSICASGYRLFTTRRMRRSNWPRFAEKNWRQWIYEFVQRTSGVL